MAPIGLVATSLCAIITATAAYAAGENVVASKKYTDDTFQTKISATDNEGGWLHVLTDSDTDGVIGKVLLVSSDVVDGATLEAWDPDDGEIPTFRVVNEYMQSKIPAGNVLLHDYDDDGVYDAEDDLQVPGLVAYDPTTGTLSGTKIGILDQETILDDEGGLVGYDDNNYENGEMDNFVPTVRAVANDLRYLFINKQDTIPKSGYGVLDGYGAYNTNAANSDSSWLNASVKGTGLVTRTSADGKIGERKIFESTDVANYHAAALSQNEKDIQDISIPTVGAMMTAIQNGSAALIPAGTAGNVVTYTGTAGVVGSVATYDGSTTYNSATDASKVAIMSAVQRKKVCAGWPDSVAVADRTDANCWLWELPD